MICDFNDFINEDSSYHKKDEFEETEIYDSEKEALKSRLLVGFRKKGYVKMPDGYEHIFVEQFENDKGEIARLVWLGNARRRDMAWHDFPPDKWQLTVIKPGHKNYEKAKKLEL